MENYRNEVFIVRADSSDRTRIWLDLCVRLSDVCAFVAGAGRAAGRGEAERRPRADLCKQAGPADCSSGLGDRRGSQPAHHPGSDVADPVLFRPHW